MRLPIQRTVPMLLLSMLLLPAWAQDAASPARPQRPVIVASVPNLILKPAHLFSLGGKTLRFLPQPEGGYRVQTLPTADFAPSPHRLSGSDLLVWDGRQKLPFAFPYGGKTWTQIFISLNGSLTFGRSEHEVEPQRSTWAAGGMRSTAAALDERSAAGQETLIAALWAVNDLRNETWDISTDVGKARFVVTWEVQRIPWGHAVEGRSRFQVRLYAGGVIEIAYGKIARQDGIVGLFCGGKPPALLLDHADARADASSPSPEAESVDVFDGGTVLEFVFNLRHDVPIHREKDQETFEIVVADDITRTLGSVTIADGVSASADVDADPRTVGYRVAGKMVTVFVSKARMVHPASWRWFAVVRREHGSTTEITQFVRKQNPHLVFHNLKPAIEHPLTNAGMAHAGNLYEVFHFPWVPKESRTLLKSLYAHLPAVDDFAVVFTDFRIDDLYAQGPSTGALNLPIQGIGANVATPQTTQDLGFSKLQVTPATVWIGSPFFSEHGPDESGTAYNHYARGVSWLAHELSHRWGPELRFRNPLTGKEEPLTTNAPHWLPDLYAPAVVADATGFPDNEPHSYSVMVEGVGTEWRENADHTFQFRRTPWWRNPGYSALDLYVMGLLPPDQVPDTFLMQNIKLAPSGKAPENGWSPAVTATKVTVRIQDILAVMGPRKPDAAHAQREFRLGVYLLSVPGKQADPAMLDRANGVALALADFFETATGHRMKVVIANAPM